MDSTVVQNIFPPCPCGFPQKNMPVGGMDTFICPYVLKSNVNVCTWFPGLASQLYPDQSCCGSRAYPSTGFEVGI